MGKTLLVSKQTFDELSKALNCSTTGDKLHRCDIDTLIKIQSNTAKQEQSKMTREEAIKKISDKVGTHYDPTTMLNVLQALGLLKFEEIKSNKPTVEWISMAGARALFIEGFDPNKVGTLNWKKVEEIKSGCFDSGYLTFGNHSVAVEEIIRLMAMKGYAVMKREEIRYINYKNGSNITY